MQITQSDCWAKTAPATGHPVLTVRDHCLIVGSVAESVLCRLGQSIRELAPDGASTLAAVHDIGKISPGFQIKTPVWDAIEVANRSVLEGNHAKIGQAWLDSLPDMRGADGRSLHLAITS